ncbi:glycosyltransferase family 61 protein, partial [Acinetobacter baumannii]
PLLARPLQAIRPSSEKMIYLTRRNQVTYSDRTIANEDEVVRALTRFGFAIVEPGNLAFEDQVSLLHGADIIVAAHGSAYGNLPFARPGSTLIDL